MSIHVSTLSSLVTWKPKEARIPIWASSERSTVISIRSRPSPAAWASPRSTTCATQAGLEPGSTIGARLVAAGQAVATTAAAGRPDSSNQKSCGNVSVGRGIRHHHWKSAAS